jgi:predicted transcriptional regulator
MAGSEEVSISEARERAGLSVGYAAEQVGVKLDELIEFESNPSIVPLSVALRIASIYRMSIDDLNFN